MYFENIDYESLYTIARRTGLDGRAASTELSGSSRFRRKETQLCLHLSQRQGVRDRRSGRRVQYSP